MAELCPVPVQAAALSPAWWLRPAGLARPSPMPPTAVPAATSSAPGHMRRHLAPRRAIGRAGCSVPRASMAIVVTGRAESRTQKYNGSYKSALLRWAKCRYHLTYRESGFAMPGKRTGSSSRGADETSEDMRALFGANFRQIRLKARLTQADVEELTGIRQHYISEIENGLQNLTLDTMTTLAQAIGTDLRSLLRRPPKGR